PVLLCQGHFPQRKLFFFFFFLWMFLSQKDKKQRSGVFFQPVFVLPNKSTPGKSESAISKQKSKQKRLRPKMLGEIRKPFGAQKP
ncbi:MAG: hypothetical protein J6A68_02770, partial [Oscillospiraceae bacterium]|nr:hypothetical protein [Oscillospiraceae bacterium]